MSHHCMIKVFEIIIVFLLRQRQLHLLILFYFVHKYFLELTFIFAICALNCKTKWREFVLLFYIKSGKQVNIQLLLWNARPTFIPQSFFNPNSKLLMKGTFFILFAENLSIHILHLLISRTSKKCNVLVKIQGGAKKRDIKFLWQNKKSNSNQRKQITLYVYCK